MGIPPPLKVRTAATPPAQPHSSTLAPSVYLRSGVMVQSHGPALGRSGPGGRGLGQVSSLSLGRRSRLFVLFVSGFWLYKMSPALPRKRPIPPAAGVDWDDPVEESGLQKSPAAPAGSSPRAQGGKLRLGSPVLSRHLGGHTSPTALGMRDWAGMRPRDQPHGWCSCKAKRTQCRPKAGNPRLPARPPAGAPRPLSMRKPAGLGESLGHAPFVPGQECKQFN